ncbi:MAG: PspC domain-containing protein [Pseudomonadales bacterium]|nr:PspC domain-containing protein [Pseudomonadales bacterium]
MSRSDQDQRDAERAARRARRLAERAEQRANRKAEQARRAAERAEKLAERARYRHRRDDERSFEDYVDDFTSKWEKKAERWFEDKSRRYFGDEYDDDSVYGDGSSAGSGESDARSTQQQARRARAEADRARRAADDAEALARAGQRSTSRRRAARRRRRAGRSIGGILRSGRGLYRDKENRKVSGVCAGLADYLDIETWKIRLVAVLGLVFIPSVTVPVYFITYFLMDDKPYYRRVSDRFDEPEYEEVVEEQPGSTARRPGQQPPRRATVREMNNTDAFRTAKEKFSDIEVRLRSMESYVTSSKFELQRELKKISGDDA